MMEENMLKKIAFYILGLAVLALGIALTTKPELGVSPIISTAYVTSRIWSISFGNATFLVYSLMVVIEIIIRLIMWVQIRHGKRPSLEMPGKRFKITKHLIICVLQLPLSFIFSKFIALFTVFIPTCSQYEAVPFLASMPGRLIVLVLAIIFTGVGAAISLNVRLIPNPGDGIVQTIADFTGKGTGLIKNCFDAFCVLTAISLGFFFAGKIIGIGIGTVLAFIGVGRVVAFYNKYIDKSAA